MTPDDVILFLIAAAALMGIADFILRRLDPDNRIANKVFRLR